MELRHLRSFLALAEERHFGRAARRLHLTQPSLSQQLQRLEADVGVPLVARTSREVRLTPAGLAFEIDVRTALAAVERARDSARRVAAGRSGTLRAGYNLPAAQGVLPGVLTWMQSEYPDVVVSPREMWTGAQLQALADGDLDVGMVYGRPTDPALESRRLLRTPLVALVGPEHPWATRGRVPYTALRHEQCLLFDRTRSPAMHDLITGTARDAGFTLDVVDELDDPVAVAVGVSTRGVVGFCSADRAAVVGTAAVGARAVAVALVDPTPVLELHAVWRRDDPNPLVAEFVRCLEAVGPFGGPGLRRASAIAGR